MTFSEEGDMYHIPDCGKDFKDVEDLGYAVVFFTKTEYLNSIDLLVWLEEEFHDNIPATQEGKARKAQFELLDKTLRKRWRKNAGTFIDEHSYGVNND